MKNILLTGGLGYIGSHAASFLMRKGYSVVLLDNLSNSNLTVLASLSDLAGRSVPFVHGDIHDTELVKDILRLHSIEAVFHFAGYKSVTESIERPLNYYDNNVGGTLSLLNAMAEAKVKTMIFSSSATVYGEPIDEAYPVSPTNSYGRSKLQVEQILQDIARSDPEWRIACLRYFNLVGAHDSGKLSERPNTTTPNNLMPYIVRVALGKLPHVNLYGNDYDTRDGIGIRDYIHIMDLVEGHDAALDFLKQNQGCYSFNLGTGVGYSVLEMLIAFEKTCGKSIAVKAAPRRSGDVASCFADTKKANITLNWCAKRSLSDMCNSALLFS